MLSVSKAMSAGDASSYFSKEDYYLKGGESSQWLGKGAESLGLNGVVEKEAFLNISKGHTPDGKEQLVSPKITKDENGNQVESHRAGNDLTFSAPKSASVAYAAGAVGIKEAHDTAVMAVMAHVENHYSQARTPGGIQNGTLVAAKFDHVTSRAIDPQLHSHCFVDNMTQTPDGQWRANEPKNFFVDQKSLGLLYRQELMSELQKAGYEIQFTKRDQMLFEIKGVDEKLIKEFSSRREAIEAKVAEWKGSGEHRGVPEAKLHEMAALDTRDPKQQIGKEDVVQKWDDGFAAVGTSREQLRESLETARQANLEARDQVKEQHQQAGQQPEPVKTADDVMKQAAEYLTSREAVMDRAQLLKTAAQISGGNHGIKDLNAAIDGQGGKENGIERLGQEIHGKQAGKEFYTTTEMRDLEARNIENLKGLGEFKSVTSRDEVKTFLDKLEKTEGIKLSAGQQAHVLNELAGDKGFAITQGDPGTGKTFASSIVERFNSEVLKPSGREHYTLNVAYTGKAAAEMSAASGKPAYTIDKFLNDYASGNIRVADPERTSQQDRAEMNRAERTTATAEHHAGEMVRHLESSAPGNTKEQTGGFGRPSTARFTDAKERNGQNGVEVLSHGDRFEGRETSYSISRQGLEKTQTKTRENQGLTAGTITKTTRKLAGKAGTVRSERVNFKGGDYKGNGEITRNDGTKSTWKERGGSFLGVKYATREERSGDSVKITKSTTWGRHTSGKTSVIGRDGQILETTWKGYRSFTPFVGDRFEITESSTRQFLDQKLADKHHLSLGERLFKSAAFAVVKAMDKFGAQNRPTEPWTTREKNSGQPVPGKLFQEPSVSSPSTAKPEGVAKGVVIPRGAQVVLKVDEASMAGARQNEHLLSAIKGMKNQGVEVKLMEIGDYKQHQSLQAGPSFNHATELAKQGYGDFAALKEINRQKNLELLKVAETLNRDGDSKQLGGNAKEALGMLQAQGRITEIADRPGLVKTAVGHYMDETAKPSHDLAKAATGEKQSVMYVTALNADRKELNQEIREARIQAGQIERGQTCPILSPARQGITAGSYASGQVVQFSGQRNQETGKMETLKGTRLNATGVVQGVNQEKNTVTVMYEMEKRNGMESKAVTVTLDAAELADKVSVFNREERDFAAGEKIVFTKNDKGLGVENGNTGTIKNMDERGNVTVTLENGTEKSFNLKDYSNLDHGYCVTDYKSQGATTENVVQFAYVEPGKDPAAKETGQPGVDRATLAVQSLDPRADTFANVTFNAFDVAMTRGTHEAHIFTNSVAGLEKTVQNAVDKTTTVGRDVPPVGDREKNGQEKVSEDLRAKIDSLEQQIKTSPEIGAQQKSELEAKIDKLEEQIRGADDRDKSSDKVLSHQEHKGQDLEAGSGKGSMAETGSKDPELMAGEQQSQQPDKDKNFELDL